MKEIGDALKEARENIGISVEEAANDLKLRPSQIENIESGNIDAFKDLYYLKYFVRDYSKYLGLSYEDMVDEFNEYLFDCTSKISLEDIKKAKKKIEKRKKKEDKVASPYTIDKKRKINMLPILITIAVATIILIVLLLIFDLFNNEDDKATDNNVLAVSNIVE